MKLHVDRSRVYGERGTRPLSHESGQPWHEQHAAKEYRAFSRRAPTPRPYPVPLNRGFHLMPPVTA